MPKGNSGKVTFKWRTKQYKKELRQAMLMRVIKAGLLLRNEHRKNLNTPYPPASRPGEYPRRRTGRLRDGVLFEVGRGKAADGKYTTAVRAVVRETTYYWVYLYGSGRLRLHETLMENSERIKRVMTSGKL